MALSLRRKILKNDRTRNAGREDEGSIGHPLNTRFDAKIRSEAIYYDHAGAALDPQFQKYVSAGDSARDARNWGEAEFQYFQALELYPFHSGYRVQYAHVIKEQDKFEWAEAHYRSAIAEGAELQLVEEHLQFTARRNNASFVPIESPDLQVASIDAPPTFYDIQTLAWLFWHDIEIDGKNTLALMRTCPTNRDVMLAMTTHEKFIPCNRPFLEIVRA